MMLKNFENIHPAYELISQEYIDEVKSFAGLLRHKKTGARLVVLSNEDKNKVFNIGFRTPPKDSTGVAHILEHSVLCGSKAFPAKDPFVELVKGSLNTFLNAMTYPDKTMYPIASCNDQDFQNLMHVYLDAVFYPNIYQHEEIFLQEGWHYELESLDSELTYNGVVYNEMKGAFSSPEQVLYRKLFSSLFPDTTYGVESGGDPDDIPNLTYEQFLDFHRQYYHPSNSYIYLYGDFDPQEKLEFLDQQYLANFEAITIDSAVQKQKTFEQLSICEDVYSIANSENIEDNTYLAYSLVLKDSLDPNLYLAFQVLDYVLMSAPGAPLKKALLDSNIARDVFSTYDAGLLQPYISIIAKNSNVKDQETFLQIIRETLTGLVSTGLNVRSLEGAINNFEFKFREADYGRYPSGLMYGLQMMDSWLYDDQQPFIHIKTYSIFEFLREQISTGYYEELIKTYMLNNSHASLLILKPEKGLNSAKEETLNQELQTYKASQSQADLEVIIDKTKRLKAYQDEPSTKEALETIPMLDIADIEKGVEPLVNAMCTVDDLPVLVHDIETNGIAYLKLLFDTKHIPNTLIPYLGLLSSVLGNINTANYTYQDLTDEVNIHTGGIYENFNVYGICNSEEEYLTKFEVCGKSLFDQMPKLFELINEIIFTTKYEDHKRLKEIIAQIKSRLNMYLNSSGHIVAALRAMSYFSENAWYRELTSGLSYYRFICQLDEHFDEMKEEISQSLRDTAMCLFKQEHLMIDYTAKDPDGQLLKGSTLMRAQVTNSHRELVTINGQLAGLKSRLYTGASECGGVEFSIQQRNEGLMTSGMVQYDAVAGNFLKDGFKYHGGLNVLKVIMDYDYLWTNLRVKGGAYGCMCSFSMTGNSYLTSYRDPNLAETYKIYKACGEYLRKFEADERDMTKYIIGAISSMDTPLNPSAKGTRSLGAYLSRTNEADLLKVRTELLNTTPETIRGFAPLVEAFVNQDNICVVGSESQIQKNKDMFKHVEMI